MPLFQLFHPKDRTVVEFTGNCMVLTHDGNDLPNGACYHSTYNGICPTHGDVSRFLGEDADLTGANDNFFPLYEERDFGTSKNVHAKLWGNRPPRHLR